MEYLKVRKKETFFKMIGELNKTEDEAKIARKIHVSKSAVCKWLNEKSLPSSNNLGKILEVYHLKAEDIGVEVLELPNKTDFTSRFNELLKENKTNYKDLAKETKKWKKDTKDGNSFSKNAIYKWSKGITTPNLDTIKLLANHFDVSLSYLLGETNIRNANNEVIANELNLTESSVQSLRDYSPKEEITLYDDSTTPLKKTEQEAEQEATGDDGDYFDIINYFLNRKEWLQVLRIEAGILVHEKEIEESLLNSKTNKKIKPSETYFSKINEIELFSQATTHPFPITPKELSYLRINKVIDNIFDDYVKAKITEKKQKL